MTEEWDKIGVGECQRLIASLSQRLQAVIKANSAHTKYQRRSVKHAMK